MNKNLTCNQVMSLLNFFISGELNNKLREYVEAHISKCSRCRKKAEELKFVLLKYQNIKEDIMNEHKESILNSAFIDNLSAYVDKELDADDNIKIKIAILILYHHAAKICTPFHTSIRRHFQQE